MHKIIKNISTFKLIFAYFIKKKTVGILNPFYKQKYIFKLQLSVINLAALLYLR